MIELTARRTRKRPPACNRVDTTYSVGHDHRVPRTLQALRGGTPRALQNQGPRDRHRIVRGQVLSPCTSNAVPKWG